jgi:hypothetical protein
VPALGVVPVHPAERRELDIFDGLPRAGASRAADPLGLEVADDGPGRALSNESPTVPIDGISASRSPSRMEANRNPASLWQRRSSWSSATPLGFRRCP